MNERSTNATRIQFLDISKLLAMYLVIFYHSSPTMAEFAEKSKDFYNCLMYFLHGLTATAVPTFFLVNGFLVLNKKLDLQKHLMKTLHIYVLTLIWSMITVITLMKIQGDRYSFFGFLKTTLFLKLYVNNHLWFLFTLVAVYIFLPLVKTAFDHPDRRIMLWVLAVLFVFSFGNLFGNWCLNILYVLIGHPIDVSEPGKIREHLPFESQLLNQFGGYYWVWVYFILGGLLGRRSEYYAEIAPNLLYLCGTFMSSLLALFVYGIIVSPSLGGVMFDNGWDGYYSIPGLLMTISMFLAFRQMPYIDGRIGKFIASVGTSTLGIYFVHLIFIKMFNPYLYQISSSSIPAHLLYSAFILLCSWVSTIVLKQVPLVSYLFRL